MFVDKMKANGMLQVNLTKTAGVDSLTKKTGKVLIKKVSSMVKPYVPIMVRGYVETPIGQAVLAQVAAAVLLNVSDNEKAAYAAKALIAASTDLFLDHVNFEEILGNLLSGVEIPTLPAVILTSDEEDGGEETVAVTPVKQSAPKNSPKNK